MSFGICFNLDQSKILKEFADDNFKFDKNGRKFSKREENTAGNGAIFPFPTMFSERLIKQARKKQGLFWERG